MSVHETGAVYCHQRPEDHEQAKGPDSSVGQAFGEEGDQNHEYASSEDVRD